MGATETEDGAKETTAIPSPGLGRSIWLCVQFYMLLIIVNTAGTAAGLDAGLSASLAACAAWAGVLALGVRGTGRPWRDVLPLQEVPLKVLFFTGLLCFALAVLLAQLRLGFKHVVPLPASFSDVSEHLARTNIAAQLLGALLFAPVAEELFFRGLVLRGLCMKYSVRKAVVLSALLFTMVHGNPWQAILAFPMGILLAWLRLRSSSLIPCMIGHVACNAQSLVTKTILSGVAGFEVEATGFYWMPAWYLATAAVFSIVAFWVLSRSLSAVATVSLSAATTDPSDSTTAAKPLGGPDSESW